MPNFKKLNKQINHTAKRGQHQAVMNLKKAHLGKQVGRLVRTAVNQAMGGGKQTAATGSGAYGRGAYGRGAYSQGPSAPMGVNSLFKEYPHRRQRLQHVADETGRVVMSRKEYVMRVLAPTTSFSNTSFSINPGLDGVFAWLSQIASNYDEYSLRHLVFHYKPVISQASQTGAMGSVLLSCNYNAGSVKFASFREMAEYMGTLETRICDEALFGVECDPKKHGSQEVEFIRTGSVPVGEDIKTYDLGLFQIAVCDVDAAAFAAGTLLGHLYVEYEVVLGKPKLFQALGKAIKSDMYRSTTGPSAVNEFPDPVANSQNTLGTLLGINGLITLPENFYGRIEVKYYITGNSTDMASFLTTGEVTPVSIMGSAGTAAYEMSASTVSAQICIALFDVQPAEGGVANTVTARITGIDAGTGWTLSITQVNPDFTGW